MKDSTRASKKLRIQEVFEEIHLAIFWGLVSLGGTGRDDISMQFASRDFRPCWIYTWVAVKLFDLVTK